MSGWESYTWFSVAVLTIGPLLVLGFFLRELPRMWRQHRAREQQGSDASPE